MCGRTPEPTKAMAEKLGIKDVRFDWRKALEELHPDIVAIATQAAPHCEMATAAAQLGCHIMCDKPLATNRAEAQAMLLAVERAGVKHAYGTTSRYAPAFTYARTLLLAQGLIGQIREIEAVLNFYTPPLVPYNWSHQLSQGGGMLNSLFTHQLGQILHMTGGQVRAAAGAARRLLDRAPVGRRLHDFRDSFSAVVDPEQAQAGKWRTVDADQGYTVMLQLQMPDSHISSALFQLSAMAMGEQPNYIAFHGVADTLYLTGSAFWPNHIQRFNQQRQAWEDLPVPQEVIASLPRVEDGAQRDWNQLFREFVADVRDEGYTGYPTFYDGWVCAEIIEIVRRGGSWAPLPEHPDGSA